MPTDKKFRIYNPDTRTRHSWTPRVSSYPPPSTTIDESPAVCLTINRQWWSFVNGVISILEEEEFWSNDKDRAVQQIRHLLSPDDCDDNTSKEESVRKVFRYICDSYPDEIQEEMEEMANLKIETIGGKQYLEEDCGCGERRYYGLTEATVNPNTGAPASELDTPPSYIDVVDLSPSNANCYADKVAKIITDALVAYTDAVFNYAVAGSLAFAPKETAALLGAVEIQQAIAAALRGELQLDFSDVGYTANEVKAAFQAAPFQEFLKDRLGDDQRVNRFVLELVQIRLNANFGLNFPTPLSPVFGAWIKTTNIRALNLALQKAAIECETGNTEPIPFTVETDGVYNFYVYRTPVITTGESYPVTLPPELDDWTTATAVIANRYTLNLIDGNVGSFIIRPVNSGDGASNISDNSFDLGNVAARTAARAANVIPAPPDTTFTSNTLWQTTPGPNDSIEATGGAAPSALATAGFDFAIVVPA